VVFAILGASFGNEGAYLMRKPIVGVMLFGGLLLGQQTKAPGDKPLPISQYMREAGLDYLEDVEKMHDEALEGFAKFLMHPLDSELWHTPNESPYGKILHTLETHIEINIRTEGDRRFLTFLEHTKVAGWASYQDAMQELDPKHSAWPRHPELSEMYAPCLVRAETIIKEAKYFAEGECTEAKFTKELKADAEAIEARNAKIIAEEAAKAAKKF
jgi:hypothetical protein